MATSVEILKKINKDHGKHIATVGGSDYEDIARLPTGIFALDLAMGGGFPQGKCSIVYGPESSNKTNIVLLTIAVGQMMFPDKKAVFADAEHALDKKWARTLGVDLDRLIIVQPDSAEQCVDFVETFMYAEDVFMVALDSIAALITKNEIESEATKVAVGGASLLVGKMYRKVTHAMQAMSNEGKQAPAFIAINQIRTKIGVMYGNPETMPGGNPPKFASAMSLRCYGKNVLDKKINPVMPAFKEVNCVIHKWKCPILAINAVYTMQMINGAGNKPGYIKDWNTVSSYMKELDYLAKGEKGGWIMHGVLYKTLDECQTALYGDPELLQDTKDQIVAELIARGGLGESATAGSESESEGEAE